MITQTISPIFAQSTEKVSKEQIQEHSSISKANEKEFQKTKEDFAKKEKISLAKLEKALKNPPKNMVLVEKFYEYINTQKLFKAKERLLTLEKQNKTSMKASDNSEIDFLRGVFDENLTPIESNSKSTTRSFGAQTVLPFNPNYDRKIDNTLGMRQVSVSACVSSASYLPAPYEAGDILYTRVGASILRIAQSGHAALIINRTQISEAPGSGQLSRISSIYPWCRYQDRTSVGKVFSSNKSEAISAASTWLLNRPYPSDYDLYLQYTFGNKSDLWQINTLYCSKLIWRAYASAGTYLDSTMSGGIIFPIDLLFSDKTLFNYTWASKY